MQKRKNTGIVILIAGLLLAVTLMDTWAVFRMTSKQTLDSGIYQLTTISGELEGTIRDAEKFTMELAIKAENCLDDREALSSFIYEQKEKTGGDGDGAYNVFIAGSGWDIIPDLNKTEDFVTTQRPWYVGAKKNGGDTYVTPPYVDALTGNICYTVSVMLADQDTVLGVDYTMENIQVHVASMYENGSRNAVIVTEEGIIAGCWDETLIGRQLASTLPDYAGIYSLAKSKGTVVTTRIKADFLYENLFATKSGNGWYLIVSESDWDLYRDSYIQLFITLVLSLALFVVIIILYLFAARNQKKAEDALASKDEFLDSITGKLREPLRRIHDISDKGNISRMEDVELEFARIHSAGEQLAEMISQIISYSSIVHTEKNGSGKAARRGTKGERRSMNVRFRTMIIIFMTLVMIVSLYVNISVTYKWGNVQMQKQVETYDFQLSEWINTQKSILDMFCSIISTQPELLDNYEECIAYLDKITKQYPEISVSYMTNPELEHTVYMNNGWEPDSDWHVEERQWYIDTLSSESGWSISAPYFDEQTGLYCVTFSEQVMDDRTGEFLGNFGIDFYMDKLVEILGDSYSEKGYAFLVDAGGDIINHPYGSYQMSLTQSTNLSELPYSEVRTDGKSTLLFKDYDNSRRILIASRNQASNFTVYVVSNIWTIYGKVVIYAFICLAAFLACIVMVYRILSDMIRWQEQTNRRMKEAADTAIAAGKAKSQFLAQMSHEIRTPINAVLGMNEMILNESKDEGILEYAGNIQAAGRNLLSIINSILDFSKIEDGKMEILPVKYDLASMINNLVNSISERAKAKSLGFDVIVDETLPSMLLGDDVRISQVIMNLLTNAVKYTEEGRVTLSIKKISQDKDVVWINFSVQDTGIGIRREDMGRLFESFERLEEKRNRNIEGTGLGMSIVTKLLKMMDSELSVDSEYGVGSNFSFRIRQQVVDATFIGDYSQRLQKAKRQEPGGGHLYAPGAAILVVDDNQMNLKVAKNLLKLCGIMPDLANSGFETLEMVGKKQYDIIFLDHMMPKMDGIETLEKLREKALLKKGTSVIALTANAIVGAREQYLEAGFDDYLSKPIELARLEEKLEKYLPSEKILPREAERNGEKREEKEAVRGGMETVSRNTADEKFRGEAENIIQPQEVEKETGNMADSWQNLKEAGIMAEVGLRYCVDDEDFYREMLDAFLNSYDEKRQEIEELYDAKDWKGYKIAVHALKSTSKTIGAQELSGLAKNLEEAAQKEDAEYIDAHQTKLLEMYGKTMEGIRIFRK